MAEFDIKISELPDGILTENTMLLSADLVNGEYVDQGHLASEVAGKLFNSFAYTQDLQTTDKKPIGAINELSNKYGVILTGVLEAGETSLTLTNTHIVSNSMIDCYCKENPTAIVVTTGQIALTFDEQEEDMIVKVVVNNVMV